MTRESAVRPADDAAPSAGRIGRRLLMGGAAATASAIPLLAARPAAATPEPSHRPGDHGPGSSSLRAAAGFLAKVTDAYATKGPRLAQSYYDGSGLGDTGFVYDNALTAIALLTVGDTTRARAIGDALLLAQRVDAAKDGRVRQAYHADRFSSGTWAPEAVSEFGFTGSAVGDLAWSAIALAQLAKVTRSRSYLTGSLALATWIVENARSDAGLGGFTFGDTPGLSDHASTEHNIDVYALATLLASLTGDRAWTAQAQHALSFVRKLWNAEAGFTWTGSDDGTTINKARTQWPLDVQTWGWLATHDRRIGRGLDWGRTVLATTDTPLRPNSVLTGNTAVTGVGFASGTLLADPTQPVGGQSYNPEPDPDGVWFEGTAQLALALRDRGGADDRGRAELLVDQLALAQCGVGVYDLGHGQTYHDKALTGGLVAASSAIDTGFGFAYNPHLHTAPTAWYVFALTQTNPYRFVRP